MATVNQSLLDAYNALFSNTPYGAALRRRVTARLQQRVNLDGEMPRGTAGAAEGAGRGGVPDPTAAGQVTAAASNASGPQSLTDRYGPAAAGLPAGWSPSTPGGYAPAGWSNPSARELGGNVFKYGSIVAGPVIAGLAGLAARGIGALAPHQFGPVPGWGMPRFTSSSIEAAPNYGGFDPSSFGVMGGQAGYGRGGPDSRGAGGNEGGMGIGGADPDRGGFGGDAY